MKGSKWIYNDIQVTKNVHQCVIYKSWIDKTLWKYTKALILHIESLLNVKIDDNTP